MSSRRVYLGVDLGRSTRAALVDDSGAILAQDRRASRLESARALADGVLEIVDAVLALADETGDVRSVGVGVPGPVDVVTRRIKALPNLGDMADVDLHAELVRRTELPVVLDNDANTAAYGEWRCGAARGASDLIYITVGTGIGAGIVQHGAMHRGVHGFAGEFGHFKIGLDGLECGCGSSGCLETVASGPNIVRRTRELLFSDPKSASSPLSAMMGGKIACEDVVEAAHGGDPFAQAVLSETASYLGLAVANAINLLDAGLVVLGGPAMRGNDFLLERVRREAVSRVFVPGFEPEHIVTGTLGADAGVVGAAMMARDEADAARGA